MHVKHFNPRSSCEERPNVNLSITNYKISIHAPHARSDLLFDISHEQLAEFQSTLLMRGATPFVLRCFGLPKFQSTLLMRGATSEIPIVENPILISIHAPHARSDLQRTETWRVRDISIHAPHARSDVERAKSNPIYVKFQSTLLMRGATRC